MQTVRFYVGGRIDHVLTIPSRSEPVRTHYDLSHWLDRAEVFERAELVVVDHLWVLKSRYQHITPLKETA